MFRNRKDAGERLAGELQRFRDAHPAVLALPRGGVPVGYEIARALSAPLDLVLVRKIGMPGQPELALGAVADGKHPETVVNEEVMALGHVPPEYVDGESKRQLEEIERRRQRYLGERQRIDVKGRTAIVVDDGVATGATIRAALRSVRRGNPARLVLALPVGPAETVAALRQEVDELICLWTPEPFFAIGAFYLDFPQVDDATVKRLLQQAGRGPPSEGGGDGHDGAP